MPLNGFLNSLSSFLPSLAPFHLFACSTLLGTELYQTFVMTKVCYQALPRSAFTTLQKRVFPIYFRGQSLLLCLTVATLPPCGPLTLVQQRGNLIPFAIASFTAILNLLVYGPMTEQVMVERIHQATRDNLTKDQRDEGAISEEMQKLNRAFSRAHAMSIHLNLVTIGATLWYGWKLASKLDFVEK